MSVIFDDIIVAKTGDSDGGDNCNFYGQNAAVLVKDGAEVTITNSSITSDATGANGVFSYGGGSGDGTTVTISDSTITTTGSASGGIMTTGGGVMNATNLTINTSGGSSAPIRTDRGGGTVTVDGGTYKSEGVGSPAIYCTADITVSDATLISEASEGIVIEGANSVTLTDCDLTANNTTKNGNAQYQDSIFLYNSQSGDADSGTSTFTMTGGSITSTVGHVIHVTNTTSIINMDGVTITNNDNEGVLLSVTNDGWSGEENIATVTFSNMTVDGEIVVDSSESTAGTEASTLTLTLSSATTFSGTINNTIEEANRGTVSLTINEGCTFTLTGDSYVTSLTNNGTITVGDYTLYVNGEAYIPE